MAVGICWASFSVLVCRGFSLGQIGDLWLEPATVEGLVIESLCNVASDGTDWRGHFVLLA